MAPTHPKFEAAAADCPHGLSRRRPGVNKEKRRLKAIAYYQTCIGRVCIGETDGAITDLVFRELALGPEDRREETPLLRQAAQQLDEYLLGRRQQFDLPLAPHGTPFQLRVWQALCGIPYGETISYKQLAERVGSPRGYRAVGLANNRNPISIFIPCHRVIGSDGGLVGYGGGLDIKKRLLALEAQHGKGKSPA